MSDATLGLGVSQEEIVEPLKKKRGPKPKTRVDIKINEKGSETVIPPKQIDHSNNDFHKQKKYDIRIDRQDGDPDDIKVGVNGTVFQIKRGVVVPVPECVVLVLRDAIASRLVQIPQNEGPPINEWVDTNAVPFSILRGPY